jgi:hypothetical protein
MTAVAAATSAAGRVIMIWYEGGPGTITGGVRDRAAIR